MFSMEPYCLPDHWRCPACDVPVMTEHDRCGKCGTLRPEWMSNRLVINNADDEQEDEE